jgi:sec-independent protein translocase protein TatB
MAEPELRQHRRSMGPNGFEGCVRCIRVFDVEREVKGRFGVDRTQFGEVGDVLGQIGSVDLTDRAFAQPFANDAVVIEHGHTVGGEPNVTLQPGRAEAKRKPERLHCVLGRIALCATVAEANRRVQKRGKPLLHPVSLTNREPARADRPHFPYTRVVFNLGPGEMIVILVAGLVVLGPEKLPDMIRKAGRLYGELRRMANGFQSEFRDVFDDPMNEFKDTASSMRRIFDDPVNEMKETAAIAKRAFDGTTEPVVETATVDAVQGEGTEPPATTGWEGANWSFDAAAEAETAEPAQPVTTGWEGAATSFDASSPPVTEVVEGALVVHRTWGEPEPAERQLMPLPPPSIDAAKTSE